MIQEAGDYLKGQLPDHPNHPKGRNPYAHVALCIKNKFSNSYKDIEDEKFEEVVSFINFFMFYIVVDTGEIYKISLIYVHKNANKKI